MASLKETKNRIASVKSTLKITSAMKMVASAKLHKSQNAIENMLPYEKQLNDMLCALAGSAADRMAAYEKGSSEAPVLIVAFCSNSSLCGGFNANAIREVRARIKAINSEEGSHGVEVIAVGKKMAEALRRDGFTFETDYADLLNHCSYEAAAELAQKLCDAFLEGKYSRIEFIYNHFISTASQKTINSTFLPMKGLKVAEPDTEENWEEYIVEPSKDGMVDALLPKVLRLSLYTTLLDTIAAEHAARTVAMQTATDNAEDILQDLTLEYNKGRQQKITAELLDIVGGTMQ